MYVASLVLDNRHSFSRSVAGMLLCSLIFQTLFFIPLLVHAQTISDDQLTVVETGDASALSDAETEVNTNTTLIQEVVTEETEPLASEVVPEVDPEFAFESDTTIDVENINDATLTNTSSTSAQTGNNAATGTQTYIQTGNSYAFANVVNVANTNIFNSTGFLEFFNQYFGVDTLDLRNSFEHFENDIYTTPSCSLETCGGDVDFNVTNSNNVSITNNVVVRSGTGGNTAAGANGAYIETGDAYAGANIINVANTNITDSNYLMLTFNNFGDMFGDVVLPGKEFFMQYFSGGNGARSNLTATNNNTANITNTVSVAADTGNNSASTSSAGSAVIATGDATAYSNTYNQVNTNIIDEDSLVILFRIHGNWAGDIFGLPDNISWAETRNGIEFFNSTPAFSEDVATSSLNGEQTYADNGSLSVQNNNVAEISNNIKVYALTGDNKVQGGGESAIVTGDANAMANVVNVANTNVLGRNWVFLIFNIFGDWNGDISFGRPDLWLGGTANAKSNPIEPGTEVEYAFTISNMGDTDATDVKLRNAFDNRLMMPEETMLAKSLTLGEGSTTESTWDLGTIKAGETKEFTYSAQVAAGLPYGETPITLEAGVSSRETDENLEDNTDYITVVGINEPKRKNGNKMISLESDLLVVKTADDTQIEASSTVNYKINIENGGGPSYFSLLVDRLIDPNGKVINEQVWDLQTIYAGESIAVDYTVAFSGSSTPGVYKNEAQIYSYDKVRSYKNGKEIVSNTASVDITLSQKGAVLGIAACSAYLNSHMSYGVDNNEAEVRKLQKFLIEQEGFTKLTETGVFDEATELAVKIFQRKYHSDILDPWGMQVESGYVYLTTKKKINELYCDGQEFPLDAAEVTEIETYKYGRGVGSVIVPKSEVAARVEKEIVIEEADIVDVDSSLPPPTPASKEPWVTVNLEEPESDQQESPSKVQTIFNTVFNWF
jgi:hypothetical protein